MSRPRPVLVPTEQVCRELTPLTPRERLMRLSLAERTGHYPAPVLEEIRNYFRIAHDRRDILGLIGQEVGDFRILDVLGRGGSGIVYLAETLDGEHQAAFKLLHPDASEGVRRIFLTEANKLRRIQCPGIPRLLGHGEWLEKDRRPRPFLVTEVVYGLPIDRYVERYAPSLERRVQLVAQVADILATLHFQHSLVHLDIKPQNILVDVRDGQPRLVDFGVAEQLEGSRVVPVTPGAVTLEFASPEHIDPLRFGVPSSRSDQYSLALVLHALLDGVSPGVGAAPHDFGRALLRAQPNLSRGLVTVIQRALNPSPEERHQDLRSFAEGLRHAAERLTTSAPRRWVLRCAVAAVFLCAAVFATERVTRPARARTLNLHGRSAQQASRPFEATAAFQRALELDPSFADARYNGAAALESLGMAERARLDYRRAIEDSRDPLPALNNLAHSLIREGRAAEAMPYLEWGRQRLGSVDSGSDLDSHRRGYRLYKNLGWAELALARAHPSGRAEALRSAEAALRLALRSNDVLREHDLLALTSSSGSEHDAAVYCLLAEVLREGGAQPPDSRAAEELARLWQSCLAAPAHDEPEYSIWKNEALTELKKADLAAL